MTLLNTIYYPNSASILKKKKCISNVTKCDLETKGSTVSKHVIIKEFKLHSEQCSLPHTQSNTSSSLDRTDPKMCNKISRKVPAIASKLI